MNEKDKYFVVAVNVFDESKSEILLEDVSPDFDENEMHLDLTRFTGKGFQVTVCKRFRSTDDEDDKIISFEHQGTVLEFMYRIILKELPLIEGNVAPGIYTLEDDVDENSYFAIRDNDDLTAAFNNLDTIYEAEVIKLTPLENKILWQFLPANEAIYELDRHPFTFFDVFCPLCGEKVFTYEENTEFSLRCNLVKNFCPHFAGELYFDGWYERPALEDLKFPYKILHRELYLQKWNGDWEKPIIHRVAQDADSYWDKDTHFLFVQ